MRQRREVETMTIRNIIDSLPDIDPEDYRLTVNGEGVSETVFTLDELKDEKKFPRVSSFRVWLAVVGEHRVSPVHRRARF